jgi:predicted MFS family arabinose efflux permease
MTANDMETSELGTDAQENQQIAQDGIPKDEESKFPLPLTLLFAVGCLVMVANLYYAQPILEYLADEFSVPRQSIGTIPSLSAGGYSAGLILITPLGDLLKRKPLILLLMSLSTLCSLGMGFTPTTLFPLFQLLAFVSGFLTCAVQIMVPFAADVASKDRVGTVVGIVMAGLMLGILLSRVISGIVTQAIGWRWMWYIASITQFFLVVLFFFLLPSPPPKTSSSGHIFKQYGQLLYSCILLLKEFPTLLQHSIIGFLNFSAFSSFWTTTTYLLSNPPYEYPTSRIGLLGIAGAVGILLAPLGGRMADQIGAYKMVGIGTLLVAFSWSLQFLGLLSFAVPIIGAITMDLGLQVQQVSNQVRIFALRPEARSRLNSVYMIIAYAGASLAPYFSTMAYNSGGWYGSVGLGLSLAVLAFVVWFIRGENGEWRWQTQTRAPQHETIVVDDEITLAARQAVQPVPMQQVASKNTYGLTIGRRMYT